MVPLMLSSHDGNYPSFTFNQSFQPESSWWQPGKEEAFDHGEVYAVLDTYEMSIKNVHQETRGEIEGSYHWKCTNST